MLVVEALGPRGRDRAGGTRVAGMVNRSRGYLAYLLRMWRVDGDDAAWRASLESPHNGERRGFATLAELFGFMERACRSAQVGETPGADQAGADMDPNGAHKRRKPERKKESEMVDVQDDKAEIERVVKRVEAAENRHDVEAMLVEMIDDPLLHLCGFPPVQGQEAVRQLYGGFFQVFVCTALTTQQIHVSSSGEMAWEQGAYMNTLKGPEGQVTEEGKYLGIYHKVEGTWKGAAFCITPNG